VRQKNSGNTILDGATYTYDNAGKWHAHESELRWTG
jgi:hypothetical protein